jgi:hypothetical protein
MQMLAVVALWAVFLVFQQLKARYPNCTWQYFAIFAAQVIFLVSVTAFCIWCALFRLFCTTVNVTTVNVTRLEVPLPHWLEPRVNI